MLIRNGPRVQEEITLGRFECPQALGTQQAASHVNQRWSLENHHLELIVEDGQCSQRGGLSAARRLVGESGVLMVYGGSCSAETQGMAEYLRDNGAVLVTPLAESRDGDFAFRNRTSKSAQAHSVLPLLEARGFRRIALLTNDTPSTQALRDSYIKLLPATGGKVVADEVVPSGARIDKTKRSITSHGWISGSREQVREQLNSIFGPRIVHPPGARNVPEQAARIAAASPDAVIVLPATVADAWYLLSVLREAGFDGPGALNHAVRSEEDIVHFWQLMEGFYVPIPRSQPDPDTTATLDGACGSNPTARELTTGSC